MKVCSGRKTAYLNGMSYEECKKLAEQITQKLKPEIIIDLHGYTSIQAKDHIRKILYEAYTNNVRCLLFITGKNFQFFNCD